MKEKQDNTQATVRFMTPVYEKIRQQAQEEGLTVASWIRVSALERLASVSRNKKEG